MSETETHPTTDIYSHYMDHEQDVEIIEQEVEDMEEIENHNNNINHHNNSNNSNHNNNSSCNSSSNNSTSNKLSSSSSDCSNISSVESSPKTRTANSSSGAAQNTPGKLKPNFDELKQHLNRSLLIQQQQYSSNISNYSPKVYKQPSQGMTPTKDTSPSPLSTSGEIIMGTPTQSISLSVSSPTPIFTPNGNSNSNNNTPQKDSKKKTGIGKLFGNNSGSKKSKEESPSTTTATISSSPNTPNTPNFNNNSKRKSTPPIKITLDSDQQQQQPNGKAIPVPKRAPPTAPIKSASLTTLPSLDLTKVPANPNLSNSLAIPIYKGSITDTSEFTDSSGGGTPPDYESRLEEISKLSSSSSPRLIHESKSITPFITINILFYFLNNTNSLNGSSTIGGMNPSYIEKVFKFSSCSTVEEVLSLIIPNLIHHKGLQNAKYHSSNDEWETSPDNVTTDNGEHQSFALFRQQQEGGRETSSIALHKEKTLLELGLKENETLELRTVTLTIQFVKISIPRFSHQDQQPANSTLKLNQFTSVRSIIRKLYLKFHTSVDVSQYGIFLQQTPNHIGSHIGNGLHSPVKETLLDEEELFSSYNINSQSLLIFRDLSTQTDNEIISQKSLQLKILISTMSSRFNHLVLRFDPSCKVSKAIKITGLRTGLLDSLNKCGFYLSPTDDEDEGFWMDEDLTLEAYHLKQLSVVEFKQRCRKYIITIKPSDRKCTFKFDQFVTVSTLFAMMIKNENIQNPKDYCLTFREGGQFLDMDRYLWSYDINEIEFRESPNRLLVFGKDGAQNLFYVDFNDPIENICKRISTDLGIMSPEGGRKRSYTLKKLGEDENQVLDAKKSLRQLGVSPNDRVTLESIKFIQDDQLVNEQQQQQASSTTPNGAPITNSVSSSSTSSSSSTNPNAMAIVGEQLDESDNVNIWEEGADSPLNIVYSTVPTSENPHPSIDAGTLNKLIIRLTSEATHDLVFMKALLMTYSSYTSSTVLLSKLFERFQVPSEVDIEDREKTSIQLRVANVIKYWVEHHYEDFGFQSTKMMVDFVDNQLMQAFPQLGNQIRSCILKRTCGIKSGLSRTRSNNGFNLSGSFGGSSSHHHHTKGGKMTTSAPNIGSQPVGVLSTTARQSSLSSSPNTSSSLSQSLPALSSPLSSSFNNNNNNNGSTLSASTISTLQPSSPRKVPESRMKGIKNPRIIFDFDDEEIARQLTLHDFMLYSAIKPTEFLNQAWNKPAVAQRKSPTILKIINRFNEVGLWVVKMILEPDRVKTRAKRMERIIRIAEKLRELSNFNTLMSFLGGLNNSSILRLKYTRGLISKKYMDILEGLEKEMSCEGSYKAYRLLLHNTDPPCVPYIGVYLTDLTFIEEGNPNIIHGNLINFAKYTLIHKVISEVQQYQWSDYYLKHVPIIQTFIRDLNPPTDKELYALSLLKEPRNAQKSDIY